MTPNSLLDAWESLGREEAQTSGIQRLRLSTEAAADLFACVFWPTGHPGLLVEGEGAYRPAGSRIPACRGIRMVNEVVTGTSERTVLRIVLEDDRLLDIFAVLSADLIDTVSTKTTAGAAMRHCIDRLCLWQSLFERVAVEGLTEEQQRGMLGELLILETLMIPQLDALTAVNTWVGPDPANQDFVHEGTAIEVKTSLSKRHSRISIANEKQLDERPYHALILAHLRFDESAVLGTSLPQVVSRLRTALAFDPAASRQFDERLMLGGYLDVHARLYLPHRWRLSSTRHFKVEGEFPRLTEANLPPGVGDIGYSIIADDLSSFEISAETAAAFLVTGNG